MLSEQQQYLQKQIKELIYTINTCTDDIQLVILKDILLKKQQKLKEIKEMKKLLLINKIQNNNLQIDNALDTLLEEQYNESLAYDRILNENNREQKMNKQWNKKVDPKYAVEVQKDHANNKLMDRMNSELAFRLNGRDKDTIIRPFISSNTNDEDSDEEIDDSDYVSINKFKNYGIPSNDFSSKRIL